MLDNELEEWRIAGEAAQQTLDDLDDDDDADQDELVSAEEAYHHCYADT